MIRLALLRHGHTAWNRAHRIQGRSDIPLDDAALAQHQALRLPDEWEKAALWSSPLKRAVQTAEAVTGRTPHTDPALTEMHWGDWEGDHGTRLRDTPQSGFRDIEHWGWDYRPPGGESPAEVRARVVPWADQLRGDAVAVCHIGVMRVLLAHATGWEFAGPAPFAIKRARLYIIEIGPDGWHARPEPDRLLKVVT